MSGTRKIKIPEAIMLGPNAEPYLLGSLVRFVIDNHPTYTSTGKGMRAAVRVENAFGLDKPEDEWVKDEATLLEEDWKQLSTSAENPPPAMCGRCGVHLGFGGYPVTPPGKLLPLLDAIADAEKG